MGRILRLIKIVQKSKYLPFWKIVEAVHRVARIRKWIKIISVWLIIWESTKILGNLIKIKNEGLRHNETVR